MFVWIVQLLPKKLVKPSVLFVSKLGKYKFVGYEEFEKTLLLLSESELVFPKYSRFTNLIQLLKALLPILVKLAGKNKSFKEEQSENAHFSIVFNPSGKSNTVKAFKTKEELQAGVDAFITRFLNLKDKKENVSISKSSIDSPKIYVK